MKSYLIAGIHTGTGKTVSSAVLCAMTGMDYWKPVQAGDLDQSDSLFVARHSGNAGKIHPERYRLQIPASPHYSAAEEGIQIKLGDFQLPEAGNKGLLVETAGGLMSPLAPGIQMAELAVHFKLPVILVASLYLGAINHTLLSVECLRNRGLDIAGLIFSGEDVPHSREYILQQSGLPHLLSIPRFDPLSPEAVQQFASENRDRLTWI